MNKRLKTAIGSMAIAGLLLSGGVGVTAYGDSGNHVSELKPSDKVKVKRATARYHSVKQAKDAGYTIQSPCIEDTEYDTGGMGIHLMNPNLIDGEVDMAKPEVLVYEPTKGGFKLVAVEYMSVGPNDLFGIEFDEPVQGSPVTEHTLHFWIWEHNLNGPFAPFNPAVSCSQ